MKKILALFVSTILTVTLAIGSTVSYVASEYIAPDTYAGPVALTLSESQSGSGESNTPIDLGDKWEPGYTALMVLNLQYQKSDSAVDTVAYKLTISKEDNSGTLASVIDVYWFPGEDMKDNLQRQDLTQARYIGTLADMMNGTKVGNADIANQDIQDYPITIVFRMREEAGNEYQGQTVPKFKISVTTP